MSDALRKNEKNQVVDWSVYAKDFDLVFSLHPKYQEIYHHCIETVKQWDINSGDVIADFGGGTGNFSIGASALPDIQVYYIDINESMMEIAKQKAIKKGLSNLKFLKLDLESDNFELPPLSGAVVVNSLYTCRDPEKIIEKISSSSKKGGYIYSSDLGRRINMLYFIRKFIWHSLRSNGLLKTVFLLYKTIRVRREASNISKAQDAGVLV